jgi:hypothetical protein
MHLISFDIGIKNMAYCMFDVSGGSMSCTSWTAMNLMPSAPVVSDANMVALFCSSCKRKAKYKHGVSEGESCLDLWLCEAHAKRAEQVGRFVRPGKEWTMAALRKKTVVQLRELVLQRCVATTTTTTTTVVPPVASKTACLALLQEWMLSHVLEPAVPTQVKATSTSANDADLIDVGRQLCLQLDAAHLPTTVHHVIIENQISPLAARMRTLQGMLTQYFIVRHPEARIHYISSSNKLKDFVLPPPPPPAARGATTASTASAAERYRQHKADSIVHCARMLAANPSLGYSPVFLTSHAKKDDLADCWLQAMWFLKHDKTVECKISWSAEDLKINCVDG